ncbi:ATP-binding protein, partial [Azohydromonas lata]
MLASLELEEGRATLRVTDHGRGIEPALLPRVFERFWLGDTSSGRTGGLGLGLSIAQHIVQRHHGGA